MAEIVLHRPHLPAPSVPGWVQGVFAGKIAQKATEAGEVSIEVDLYSRPQEGARCDRNFINAFFNTYPDGTKEGARKYFELLQKMPSGHSFAGIVPDDPMVLLPVLLGDPLLTIGVRGQMYSPDGRPLELAHVALAHFTPLKKSV